VSRAVALALGLALAGCAGESIVADAPRAVTDQAIAPYEVHEECARLAVGDRLDYRFDAQAPVTFHLYYQEGTTFLSPITREDVTEASGVFLAREARRYCLRWEAGRQGAIISYRVRLLPTGTGP
jgi:hypothetical protein